MAGVSDWKSAVWQYYGAFVALLLVIGAASTFTIFPVLGSIWGRVVSATLWIAAAWIISGAIIRKFDVRDGKSWRKICSVALLMWIATEIAGLGMSYLLDMPESLHFPASLISKAGQCVFILMPAIRIKLGSIDDSKN